MSKLIASVERLQELVGQIKDQTAQLFPSPMEPAELLISDVDISGTKPDEFNRYEITEKGVTFKPTFARGASKDLTRVDVVRMEAKREFKIGDKEFPKGFSSIKLVAPGSFKPAKAKATRKETATA